MVLPFVTAHMFCVSPDDPRTSSFLHVHIWEVPTSTGQILFFCAVYNYVGKPDLSTWVIGILHVKENWEYPSIF